MADGVLSEEQLGAVLSVGLEEAQVLISLLLLLVSSFLLPRSSFLLLPVVVVGVVGVVVVVVLVVLRSPPCAPSTMPAGGGTRECPLLSVMRCAPWCVPVS